MLNSGLLVIQAIDVRLAVTSGSIAESVCVMPVLGSQPRPTTWSQFLVNLMNLTREKDVTNGANESWMEGSTVGLLRHSTSSISELRHAF